MEVRIIKRAYTTGDQYGIIRPNSRMTREYGIEVNGEVWFEVGTFLSQRGVKLAVLAIKAGATRDQINRFGADDVATRIAHLAKSFKPNSNERYDKDELTTSEIQAVLES